ELICPGSYATTSYAYDRYGNSTNSISPVGISTSVDYDSSTATFPTRNYTGNLTNNLIEYTTFDPRTGALQTSTDMQGLVTANSVDGILRLTNVSISTTPNGSATLWRTRYEYWLGGIALSNSYNYTRVQRNDPTPPGGHHETYPY